VVSHVVLSELQRPRRFDTCSGCVGCDARPSRRFGPNTVRCRRESALILPYTVVISTPEPVAARAVYGRGRHGSRAHLHRRQARRRAARAGTFRQCATRWLWAMAVRLHFLTSQVGEIIGRFEAKGYKLVAIKMITPTKKMVYPHLSCFCHWNTVACRLRSTTLTCPRSPFSRGSPTSFPPVPS
jgi:hypothetical protein